MKTLFICFGHNTADFHDKLILLTIICIFQKILFPTMLCKKEHGFNHHSDWNIHLAFLEESGYHKIQQYSGQK